MAELWDYLVVAVIRKSLNSEREMTVNGVTTEIPSLQAGLQTFGDEGWELVTLTQARIYDSGWQWIAFFKRRKP